MSPKRLFIVAGEASGDAHAARLLTAAKEIVPDLYVEGLGGEKMRQAGCQLHADLTSTAVMGFIQVAMNLRFFRNLLKESIERIKTHRPDAVVLVDYPGFNLRLAAAAKELDIPVVYYISPQVWAWRPRRIHKIAELVDKMIVILPFEEELYRNANVDVTYVGHPLLDSIAGMKQVDDFIKGLNVSEPMSVIGLLPGSRKQEIVRILPALVKTAKILMDKIPEVRFLIPCSSQETMGIVKDIIGSEELPISLFTGRIYEVAQASHCCIVASGTATLEVACFLTPLIVVYKTGFVAWHLGRRFLHVKNISLVNILAGREIVPEMLQGRMRADLLADEVLELCKDGEKRETMIKEMKSVRARLGTPGASAKAAKVVCDVLEAGKSAVHSAELQEKFVATNG